MMDVEYTAGPWSVDDEDLSSKVRAPDGTMIAQVHQYKVGKIGAAERRGNARLIAAAPELRSTGTAMAETAMKLIEALCNDEDWSDIADRLNDQVGVFRRVAFLKGGAA